MTIIQIGDEITISPDHTHGPTVDPTSGTITDAHDSGLGVECNVCHQTLHISWEDETGERRYVLAES